MKKIIFTLLSFTLLFLNSNAQHCSTASGPSVCTPISLDSTGLSPVSDSLAPVVNGTMSSTRINIKNYNTLSVSGLTVTMNSLHVDSIEGLPSGLCWASNKSTDQFGNQEEGCMLVTGTVCDVPGQYRLRIWITVNVSLAGTLTVPASFAGLYYYVRVKNAGDADQVVDTLGQTPGTSISTPNFKAYGPAAICTNGIEDLNAGISSLTVVPNPFNNKAVVTFFSEKSATMTERITNMIGSEVYSKEIEIAMGENKSTIDRNNLPVGVYFYSLGDGKNFVTKKRLVISE